jgi:hypothetical protein
MQRVPQIFVHKVGSQDRLVWRGRPQILGDTAQPITRGLCIPAYIVHINVSRETNRCNNVKNVFLSWITSTCFGHYYAHHQDTNISRLFYDFMRSCLFLRPVVVMSCAMGLVHTFLTLLHLLVSRDTLINDARSRTPKKKLCTSFGVRVVRQCEPQ